MGNGSAVDRPPPAAAPPLAHMAIHHNDKPARIDGLCGGRRCGAAEAGSSHTHTHTLAVKSLHSDPAVMLYMGKSNRVFNRPCHRATSIIFQAVVALSPQEAHRQWESVSYQSPISELFNHQ